MTERRSIRLVDGRRMQCKDIPNEAVLAAVRLQGDPDRWWMSWDVQQTLETAGGPIPDSLCRVKIRRLFDRKILGGCACGCCRDFYLVAERQGGMYCCCLDEPAAWTRLRLTLRTHEGRGAATGKTVRTRSG